MTLFDVVARATFAVYDPEKPDRGRCLRCGEDGVHLRMAEEDEIAATFEWQILETLVKAAVEWRESGFPRKFEDWDYDTRPALEAAVDAWIAGKETG